jgi:hypothetical protein
MLQWRRWRVQVSKAAVSCQQSFKIFSSIKKTWKRKKSTKRGNWFQISVTEFAWNGFLAQCSISRRMGTSRQPKALDTTFGNFRLQSSRTFCDSESAQSPLGTGYVCVSVMHTKVEPLWRRVQSGSNGSQLSSASRKFPVNRASVLWHVCPVNLEETTFQKIGGKIFFFRENVADVAAW